MITVRTTSNPVFRNLPKQEGNGYASFGSATAGAAQVTQQFGQPQYAPAEPYQTGPTSRAMTIDDVVTKTAHHARCADGLGDRLVLPRQPQRRPRRPFVIGGGLVGLVLVLVATFGRKMDNPAIVLATRRAEGLFLGALSFMFTDIRVRRSRRQRH